MIIIVNNFPYIVLRTRIVKCNYREFNFDIQSDLIYYEIISYSGNKEVYYKSASGELITRTNFKTMESIEPFFEKADDRVNYSCLPIENVSEIEYPSMETKR